MYRLHQRWASLHARVENQLVPKLTSRSYVQEGVTVTKKTEVHTQVRLVETNEAFKHVQNCLDWIQGKQVSTQISHIILHNSVN